MTRLTGKMARMSIPDIHEEQLETLLFRWPLVVIPGLKCPSSNSDIHRGFLSDPFLTGSSSQGTC